MKKALLIIFFSIFNIGCNQNNRPVIYYHSKIIELGDVEFNKSYHGKILLKNKGMGILKITGVSADCSCTVPNMKKKKIIPGDSAYIDFILTPAEDGFIQQSIFVENNSVNENRVLFLIRGKVRLLK